MRQRTPTPKSVLRVSALRERVRSSLWLWPALAVGVAILAGTILPMLERGGTGTGFAGTPDGARAVLSTVAGSTITVTGLTFSLTVVALQVASSQFTPRLLDTFLADRGNQAVLSVFLGTFAYTLAVLRSVRSADPGSGVEAAVPDLAVAVGLDLTLLSVAMLVYFFHHLTQQLRVESVLGAVRRDTVALIRRHTAARDSADEPERGLPVVPDDAQPLRALRTGYLQAIDVDILSAAAAFHGVVLCLRPVVGTHVTVGTTVAWAWPDTRQRSAPVRGTEALTRHVHDGIHLGAERTLQQDIAFGVRQLVDIAARALSPGVNDPATAVAALGALAAVLVELAEWRLDPIVQRDPDGRVRAMAPQQSFAEILSLACDQPRRYGSTEPAVLTELVRMLTDLAEVCHEDEDRRAVRQQVDATVEAAVEARLNTADLARVQTFARHATVALERGARVAAVPAEAATPAW